MEKENGFGLAVDDEVGKPKNKKLEGADILNIGKLDLLSDFHLMIEECIRKYIGYWQMLLENFVNVTPLFTNTVEIY